MVSRFYSKAVLVGLRRIGISDEKIIEITGLSSKKLNAMLEEKAAFEDTQLEKIEIATRKTAGQLATIGAGIQDKGMSELMDRWAETAETVRPKQKTAHLITG